MIVIVLLVLYWTAMIGMHASANELKLQYDNEVKIVKTNKNKTLITMFRVVRFITTGIK